MLYPLPEILLLCLCAVLGGADSWVEVALYGQRKLGFLRRLLPFAHGVPSHDQLGHVFARLDAQQFQSCFIAWVERFTTAVRGVVAVDGKTLRRSFDRAAKQGRSIDLGVEFTAAAGAGAMQGGEQVERDHGIPQLLQLLELHGAVVTIDAMGCQRTIAAQIIDQADYVFGLKGNQRTLHKDVALLFDERRMVLRGTRSPCMRVLRRATGAWKRAVWLRPMILRGCRRTTNGRACAA